MSPLILLHGAIGASDQLQPLAEILRQKGFEAHTMDFAGHGKKDFGESFGIDYFAWELKRFVKEHNLEKPGVFGYSMGGYVALYLASKEPELLGNIVTLGTKFDWSPDIAAKEIKMLDPKAIEAKVPKFAAALKERHGDKWMRLLEKTAAMMTELGDSNLLNKYTFATIRNKVFIGLADADNMVTLAETDDAARKLVSSKRFTLADTKHPIETVDVNALAEMLRGFLG